MQNTKLLVFTILGSILLVIGLGWALSWMTGGSAEPIDISDPNTLVKDARNVIQPTTSATDSAQVAPYTLIEFSDLQCPACAAQAPLVKALLADQGDKITFIYRHFPLLRIHPNSMVAAQAAEAAGEQGKFWEMHDALFATQNQWAKQNDPAEHFRNLARDMGLDLEKFNIDYQNDGIKDRVLQDLRMAEQLKLSGTPTFILNGEVVSIDQAREIIESGN